MSIDDKTLRTTLRELGRTAAGVRRSLWQAGITGKPEDGESCAVAQYLRTKFPDESEFVVSGFDVRVNGAVVKTTAPIGRFIAAFDDRTYPELIEHAVGCGGPRWDYLHWSFGERSVCCSCGALYQSFDEDEKSKARYFYNTAVADWATRG